MSEQQPLIAGRYQLEQLIGRGGMGDVYRGVDIETGTPVAIKQLHVHIVDENPDIVDRFIREGEALRRLNHPSIVQLLGAVEENGKHYLIMEYVGGGSLRDLIDEQARLPLEAVLNIALDLADALTRAHRLNIIHRDIKPDNVLLAEDGTPRLTDFGVAHMADRTRLTQTGSVIGTYAYLSPEACNGLELDERADIWSFGIMLFEMLAGRVPFSEQGTAAILTAILTKPAPDITRLRPGTPEPLADLVARMLEKDRERRISSVRVIGAEIEALIRGLDTPLRDLVLAAGPESPRSSRFSTPSDEVPAMARSLPQQTHGLSLYPSPQSGGTLPPPPASFLPGAYTPGGTPITAATVPPATKWKWIALMVIVTVLACSIVAVIALLLGPESSRNNNRDESEANTLVPGLPGVNLPLTGGAAAGAPPLIVEPVGDNEYMVLVAQMEPLSGAEPREVSRFIVDDLVQTLEVSVPFSMVRIRDYPAVITSATQAQQAANANHATVIIWGSYTPEAVQVEIQTGTLAGFEDMLMDRKLIEQAANVRVSLTDERQQSVAQEVLGVMAVLQGSNGDIYEYMRTLGVMAEVEDEPAEIVGDNVAAYIHRYFMLYNENTPAAIEEIDKAIEKDPSHPFSYALRSVALHHQERYEEAHWAAETSQRLGPDGWVVPLVLIAEGGTFDEGLSAYDQIVAQRPNDWYAYSMRGTMHYMAGNYAEARADLERAIALTPNANYPYAIAALLAMEEGRFEDADRSVQVILDEFPDPDLYSRIIGATIGGHDIFGPMISAFINLAMGRYEQAAQSADAAVERAGPMPNLFTIQGLAWCSLGDYESAATAYTSALASAGELGIPAERVALVHLLRGDVLARQGDHAGANADFDTARNIGSLPPAIQTAVEAGELGCENFISRAAALEAALLAEPAEGDETSGVVEPIEPGEYMVLVAPLEPLSGAEETDQPARFIADDLQRALEQTVPYSNIRVRLYPDMITSDDEAQLAAKTAGASVIVWGNYSADLIELNVQMGITDGFPYLQFPRDLLERSVNVRVHMTSPQRESVAPFVLNILHILHNADGNSFEALRTAEMQSVIRVTPAEVVGNTVAANMHRIAMAMNDAAALTDLQEAQALDAGNALLYIYSSIIKQRAGQFDDARRDAMTAQRIGPPDWSLPLLVMATMTTDESVLDLFNQVIEQRPDDWFPYFFRGSIYYELNGLIPNGYELARADLDKSIELKPTASFPYVYRALLALHEGRIADAAAVINLVLTEFPDPTYMQRLVQATFSDEVLSPYSLTLSAFTNLTLGQYTAVLDATAAGLEQYPDVSDIYLEQGTAYCGLGDFASAETSFATGLEKDPGFVLLHLLRADARLQQGDESSAAEDLAAIEASDLRAEFDPLVDAVRDGSLGCANFFSPDNPFFRAASAAAGAADFEIDETALQAVEPVEPGQYMVLVADLEALDGATERDVARFVAEDLRQIFEEEIRLANVHVRQYPAVVTSAEEARAVAERVNAQVIVWGRYTAEQVELEVQVGATSAYRHMVFPYDTLAQTANVRVQITDERRESVAPAVLNAFNILANADGDEFRVIANMMLAASITAPTGTIDGNSLAAHLHRGLLAYGPTIDDAIEEFDAAIEQNPDNPLPYVYRSLAYMRVGNDEGHADTSQTIQRLAPDGWAMPLFWTVEENMLTARRNYDRLAELRPDDWFVFFLRGTFYYYGMSDLEQARAEFGQSIALKPAGNLPYIAASMIALREGEMSDAQDLFHTVLTEYPDPELTNRAMEVVYGENAEHFVGPFFSAATNYTLGQYDDVISQIDTFTTHLFEQPEFEALIGQELTELGDLYTLEGLTYCNMKDYAAAETAYDRAIGYSHDFKLLYLLRGQARQMQGKTDAAQEDFATARDHMLGAEFDAWVEAGAAQEWTCETMTDYQPGATDE